MKSSKMNHLCFFTTLAIVISTMTVWASENSARNRLMKRPSKGDATLFKTPILFEVEKQKEQFQAMKSVKASLTKMPPLKPNRVYLYFIDRENKWIFVVTDNEGNFSTPIEGFISPSVLSGDKLGAKDPKQRFVLTLDGVWTASYLPEQEYYWVYSDPSAPQRFKTVTYEVLGSGGSAQ